MDESDRYRLFASMIYRKPIVITSGGKTYKGIVNTIQAEDGSGWCFNLVLDTGARFFYRARAKAVA